jgi:hypothetical protein
MRCFQTETLLDWSLPPRYTRANEILRITSRGTLPAGNIFSPRILFGVEMLRQTTKKSIPVDALFDQFRFITRLRRWQMFCSRLPYST